MTTFKGFSTAIRRCAVRLSTSRTEKSNIAMSTTLFALARPTRLTKSRIAAGRTPRRRPPAAAQAGDGLHARIVPAADMAVPHELGEHALGQHRVGEVEPGELVLTRMRPDREVVEEPVVERPVVLEFKGAQGVGDPFDRI